MPVASCYRPVFSDPFSIPHPPSDLVNSPQKGGILAALGRASQMTESALSARLELLMRELTGRDFFTGQLAFGMSSRQLCMASCLFKP